MKLSRRPISILTIAMLLALAAGLLAACSPKDESITSLDQLNQPGIQIGVSADAPEYSLVEQEFPQAEIVFTKDLMAAYTSVDQGKIDAFVGNKLNMELAIYNGLKGVRVLDEPIGKGNIGAAAISPSTKIPDLKGRINEFLKQAESDGTIADMRERWMVKHVMKAQIDVLKKPRSEAYETGMKLLKRVGLANRATNYPDELSGGQKQRVAIARTLATDPEVILFDEPTSALDPTMVGEVQSVIRDLTHTDKTMLIVTHEMSFARAVCSRVFYMDQGGIYEEGTPDQIFDNPQKDLTRRFIRKLRVLELKVDSPDFDFAGAGTEIDSYCLQNDVSPSAKYRIRLAFEELTCNILKPVLGSTPLVISAEHSAENDETEITALYGGEKFDPAKSGDGFVYSVLESTVKDLSYRYDPNAEQTNAIRILI